MPLGEERSYVVYQAERLNRYGKIEAREALLLLRSELREAAARVHAQALLLRQSAVPGLASMDRVVDIEGRTGILREMFDGISLSQAQNSGPMGEVVAAMLVGKVAAILNQTSSLPGADGRPLGLLHGSVRPSAVFLQDNGQVSLLDFGLVGTDPTDGLGRGDGDWGFVPPERWRGLHKRAGEVYSLGAVYFQALTGQPLPEAGRSEDEHRARMDAALRAVPAPHQELLSAMLGWNWRDRPTWLEVSRQTREFVGTSQGAVRTWAEQNNAAVRRRIPWPPPDAWSNRLVEVDCPDVTVKDGEAQAWDDVTASYPIGSLRGTGRDAEEGGLGLPPPEPETTGTGRALFAIAGGVLILGVVGILAIGGALLLFL